MSDSDNKPTIAKVLMASNRHLLTSLEHIGGALYFEVAESESHAPSVMKAHKEAVWAVKQLADILDRLGVAGVCGKCNGSGESVGMTHRQECAHCEKGLIYRSEKKD
jgi:bacterioferritin-associated ferredoxin